IRLAAEQAGIEGEPRLKYPVEGKPFDIMQFVNQGGEALARGVVQGLTQSAGGVSSPNGGPGLLMMPPMGEPVAR
ncbi:MAG: hypothetical protein IJC63_06020, partial [Myxococcaceae bacterium]|nr:hypothetical protein [Myxococcaceae bacterium]